MGYKHHRSRKDGNHRSIVDALEAAGCRVLDLSAVGGGCSDLLCYRPSTGLLRLIEIKNPATTLRKNGKRIKAHTETERKQEAFALLWPTWKVWSVDGALEAMDIKTEREARS